MASVIESHPKRTEIDALLMEGLGSRKIVARLGLPYAHSVITDYRRKVFLPAVRTAHMLLQREPDKEKLSNQSTALAHTTRSVSAAKPILDALEKRLKKRERWEELAEADSNWPALASFDRTGLADLRTEAELTGALNSGPVEHLHMHMLVEPARRDVEESDEPVMLGPGDVEIVVESTTIESPTDD